MKKLSRRRLVVSGIALYAGAGLVGNVQANGDDFFGLEDLGPVEFLYFGSVKDEKGRYLSGAEVTLQVSEPELIFVETTDVIGRFRTGDVGQALIYRGYDVDPSTFKISVKYPGYRPARKIDRRPGRLIKGSFEVNFVMSKETEAQEAKD